MNFQKYLLQNALNIKKTFIRTCKQLPKGIKYFGFTYYPRCENFKDPPYNPSKLFLVIRIKSMKGLDPKERRSLELLNLDGEKKYYGHYNVVKNIPSVNALLWKVKHLVEIRPITWKGELPPLNGDYSGTYLRKTGEFIMTPKLNITPEQIKVTEEIQKNPNRLRRSYMKNYLRNKWLNPFYATV